MLIIKLAFVSVLIIVLAVGIVRFPVYLKSRRAMRNVEPEVKNLLLSGGDYCGIDNDVIRLVRKSIVKKHIVAFIVTIPVFLATVYMYFGAGDEKITIMLCGAVFPLIVIVKVIIGLARLSDSKKLIKIKGFIFATRESGRLTGRVIEVRILYYDRKKLKFRYFVQSVVFDHEDLLKGGRVVNLIAKRDRFGIHIIRALTF